MGENSAIAWTDHTFNPWWGCQRVSPGCERCYAETFSKRVGLKVWGPQSERRFFGDKHWREPRTWNDAAVKAGKRARVFCASMADVFEDRRDLDAQRARVFQLIEETPALDWQLLTKRPENVRRLVPDSWLEKFPENVWMGTTVEDQRRADERIIELRRIPASLHWLSMEPLLGPTTIRRHMWPSHWAWDARFKTPEEAIAAGAHAVRSRQALVSAHANFIRWVVLGFESGHGRRPREVAWMQAAADECADAEVPVFVKQDTGPQPGKQGEIPDALWALKQFPATERDGRGR